jgi:hypothetical protein
VKEMTSAAVRDDDQSLDPDRLVAPDYSFVSREVFDSGSIYQREQRRIFEKKLALPGA